MSGLIAAILFVFTVEGGAPRFEMQPFADEKHCQFAAFGFNSVAPKAHRAVCVPAYCNNISDPVTKGFETCDTILARLSQRETE